jgi:hypothetical protein
VETPDTDTDTATSAAAGSHTTAAAAAAEAPATETEEQEVPGATPAEVDAARSAVRVAITPARVATGTRSLPAYVNKNNVGITTPPWIYCFLLLLCFHIIASQFFYQIYLCAIVVYIQKNIKCRPAF